MNFYVSCDFKDLVRLWCWYLCDWLWRWCNSNIGLNIRVFNRHQFIGVVKIIWPVLWSKVFKNKFSSDLRGTWMMLEISSKRVWLFKEKQSFECVLQKHFVWDISQSWQENTNNGYCFCEVVGIDMQVYKEELNCNCFLVNFEKFFKKPFFHRKLHMIVHESI